MRAVTVPDFKAAPELVDLPRPEAPGPGEILVRMRAAGYNPYDLKVADGALKDVVPHRFPLVLGSDGAGVIEAVGPDVSNFRVGDRVYGQFLDPAKGRGSYADYVLADLDQAIARMPEGMIFSQAAAVPTSSMTAYNMVCTARVDSGQKVLIMGATGGVGQAAVQLAAQQGAHVIATAPRDASVFVQGMGATETVDFTSGPVGDQVAAAHPEGIDAVIDLVSPPSDFNALAKLVKPGGILLSSIGSANVDALATQELRGVNFVNKASGELLTTLATLIDAGKLKVWLEQEVPLTEAPEALRRLKSGDARGKTVFEI